MYGLTKSISFSIISSLLVGVLAISYLQTNTTTTSNDDGFNDYPMSATEYMLQREIEKNPAVKTLLDAQEAPYQNYIANVGNAPEADFTLPVVVHIVHENGAENIDNAQVQTAIDFLNDAYENVGFYDQGTGVNTEIEFCLAKTDPDGDPSTGVTRTEDALTNMTLETEDQALKNLSRWDPTRYINIWIVRSVGSDAIVNPDVKGYSYLPAFHGTDMDGIVIEAAFVGADEENTVPLVREMGHYLGLYSTFHAGCGNDNCLMDGDMVCDTPPDWTIAEAPCEVDENSCFTDVNLADPNNPFTVDENDLRENYMDINPLECMSAFTQGQTDRMTFFITGARSSLLANTISCMNDCDSPIENLSILPGGDTTIVINNQGLFISNSTNASTFEWTLNGIVVGNAANQVLPFDSAGVFTLTLTASNADADCDITASLQVTVIDCFGNTYVNDATGTDVFMCGQPGNPCKTIQYALDNSVCSGDTIFIHSGTYSLPAATAATTPVALIPEDYTVTFYGVEDSGPVIIDGGGVRRGFVYNYTGDVCPPVFPNNGIAVSNQINFAQLTIQNTQSLEEACTNGEFNAGGAAIYLVNNFESTLNVTIDDCRIINNETIDDDPANIERIATGAVFFNGHVNDTSAVNTNASITVTNSEFSNNRAEHLANGATGGALSLYSVRNVNISQSYFCENSVFSTAADNADLGLDRNAGGAIAIFDETNTAIPFNNNHSISNCFFFNNSATTSNGAGFMNQSEGGAVFFGGNISDQSVTSTAVLLIGNSSFYNNNIETGIEHFDNSVGSFNLINNNLQNNSFTFDIGNDTTICNTDSITIGTTVQGADYLWSTGATTGMIRVGDTGVYVLTIAMGACEFVDSIVITEIICGEICGNGIDDDGDGLIDCYDSECCGLAGCDDFFYDECPDCDFTNTDEQVQAEIKWETDFDVSNTGTPITADIDGDGWPEVIIPNRAAGSNTLRIIDGRNGNNEMNITVPTTATTIHGQLAVADVDKDGTGEIFYFNGDDIYRFEHDGTQTATFNVPGAIFRTVGIADFDEDGTPEVYGNNVIFNSADLTVLATVPVTTADAQFSVAVDVLDDAACPNCEGLELVMGNTVYSVNLTSGVIGAVVQSGLDDGIVSIADIDKDGDLDGVVSVFDGLAPATSNPLIYAWELQTNAIIGQFIPNDNASPSTLADIDGDGQIEIVFKTETDIVALENNFSLKWSTPAMEDNNNFTSPITFDFDGDGDFEVVSRGQIGLEILDGTNGALLFTDQFFSITRFETPVIVDVDGDGLTEILVTGAATLLDAVNDNDGRLRAYTSSSFPWQTTREIWNQAAYFNVNVSDNTNVPTVLQEHHIVGDDVILNNFLTQHGEQLGADALIASVDVLCDLNELIVTLEICNTGDNELSNTTPITFYTADPTAGSATTLDTEILGSVIQPDSCTFVEFTIPAQYDDPVFIVVNDDSSTNTPFNLANDFPNTNIGECDYANNMISFTEVPEPFELDLGGTIMICDNAAIELNATTHFVSYEWQDGTTDSTFTAYDGGMYTVTVIDSCGGTQIDSVQLIVDPNTVNMTMPENAVVCPTQDTSFTVMGDFDTYVWIPNDFLDCDTCQTVNVINPDEEMQYIVTASNSLTGCHSVDTVLLSFTSISTTGQEQVCPGESIIIHGNEVSAPNVYTETFTSVLGCDSTSSITLTNFNLPDLNFQATPTCPAGSIGSATVFVSNGTATNYDWSISGAGNSPTVNNLPAGIYSVTVTDDNMCTTEGSVEIVEDNNINLATDFISPSCPGESDGVLEILNPSATWTGFSLDGVNFQTSPIFMNLPQDIYTISVQEGDCVFTDTGAVDDPDGTVITGNVIDGQTFPDSASINVTINSPNVITDIQWSPTTGMSCTDCLNPSILPLSETSEYTITVTDANGCVTSETFIINIVIPCDPESVEIPNAFTPDQDGVNDTFGAVVTEGIERVTNMRIYNRWGNLVFESADGSENWDGMDSGKNATMDVYVYVITIECSIGEPKTIVKSGDVTLIR